MGCSLHRYVEYKGILETWSSTPISGLEQQDYDWFGFICNGVRTEHDTEKYKVHEPVGFPDDAGIFAFNDFFLREDECKDKQWYNERKDNLIRMERKSILTNENKCFIQNPNFYGATWMTLDEYLELIDSYKKFLKDEYSDELTKTSSVDKWTVHLDAIAEYMKSYEKQGLKTRIIYWFDG